MTHEEAINNLKKILGFSPTYDEAFYTLFPNGAESSLSSDVDEAAKQFVGYDMDTDELRDYEIGVSSFKAGVEWHKEQMLKEAAEGTITCQNLNRYILVPGLDESLIYGDKVRIIILKEN